VVELKGRTEPGKMAVRVRWMQGDKNVRSDNFLLESRLNQTVLLAAATIPRGEVCVAQNFVEERRLLDSRVEKISAEEAAGRKAKRPLAQGEVVTAKDLVVDRMSTANVRPRDSVKVIAKKGPLRVVLQTAEALQAGRPGDIIRVRNLQSGQIINGKVITAKEVEVSLD
jgi:flagella basal body P-ring formation protein FlgA